MPIPSIERLLCGVSSLPTSHILPHATLLLHGSLTRGIADDFADIDLWLLAPHSLVAEHDRLCPTRFIELPKIDGRPGHVNIESADEMAERVAACDIAIIDELRHARVLTRDCASACATLERARRPMSADVRRQLFMHHYVEFRSEHRAMDNPIERGDGSAVLFAAADALEHSLRALLVLQGMTYPYKKWLARCALASPLGQKVGSDVAAAMQSMAHETLTGGGPEREHPLSMAVRRIRTTLIALARDGGLDGEYLDKWWLHLTAAREAMATARW